MTDKLRYTFFSVHCLASAMFLDWAKNDAESDIKGTKWGYQPEIKATRYTLYR